MSAVFPLFPIRREEVTLETVRLVVVTDAAKLCAVAGGSMILSPAPFKVREVNVGLCTPRLTDVPALIVPELSKVAVPEDVPVETRTDPFVLDAVAPANRNSSPTVAAALERRLISPSTVSTRLVVSHKPNAFALLRGLAKPFNVMSPEVLDIVFVPVDAVPPHPIRSPMWFPVLVIVPDTSVPSTSMLPVVVEILAGFSISIPEL
jgi:hypothetical protein